MDSIQITDREQTVHTPWFVLLYKAMQTYREVPPQNGNENEDIPAGRPYPDDDNYKQKLEFKAHLKEYLSANELHQDDDSYEEALKAVTTVVQRAKISAEVQAILDDSKISRPEDKFWILCAALKQFVNEKDGQLPVSGVVPDMTANSEKYILLQNVYREKAARDATEMFDRATQLINQTGNQGRINLTLEDVKLFCKESNNLRLIRGYAIYEELQSSPNSILTELENMEDCDQELMFYIILRGYLRFENENKRYPGVEGVEPDMSRFKATVTKLLNEWNTSVAPMDDCIHEICRYGGAEIHSVAAFIGGCAAQEAIKIVTSQYVPLDNTLIYNAITSSTRSFKLRFDP